MQETHPFAVATTQQNGAAGEGQLPKLLYCKSQLLLSVMKFTKLVPNIFYADIRSGLKIFVECLEFSIGHDELNSDQPFCVVEKDGLRINLFENKEYAEKDNPEFRLVTDDIEEVYKKVASKYPELLHPNLSKITLRPWGAKEFALTDEQIGIIIQQW
jgi:hypothetical protein